jgi:hypothetical protein
MEIIIYYANTQKKAPISKRNKENIVACIPILGNDRKINRQRLLLGNGP